MTICKLNIISKLKTSYIVGTEGTKIHLEKSFDSGCYLSVSQCPPCLSGFFKIIDT